MLWKTTPERQKQVIRLKTSVCNGGVCVTAVIHTVLIEDGPMQEKIINAIEEMTKGLNDG